MAEGGRVGLRARAGSLLEALFPGRCLLCGRWLQGAADDGAPLCDGCRAELGPLEGERCSRCGMQLVSEKGACMRCRDAEYAFESNIALFAHGGAAKTLLRGLKFGGRTRLAPFFAAHAASALREAGRLLPLVPVPPRPGRGGPDTAELVARCLGRGHGMDVRRLLARAGGAQQKRLSFTQRRDNLAGRIHLRGPVAAQPGQPCIAGWPWGARPTSAVIPLECVLLDDVFTTGATLDACARVLKEAGCARVYGLTLVIEE
jgi:competence protein ComFC